MIRLYQKLLVRLMSNDVLDAIHILHDELLMRTEGYVIRRRYPLYPHEHAIERIGDLLDDAEDAGWSPKGNRMSDSPRFD